MEINKQKINKLLRRMSPPEFKSKDNYHYNSPLRDFFSPKKSVKKTLLRGSSKPNCSSKRILCHDKSYVLNKTSVCTPYDKSTMLSYVSTPNQKSFNVGQKMKALKCSKKFLKTKECFNSTQDETYSEQTVKVNFTVNGKKIFSKYFANFVSFQNLKEQFAQEFLKMHSDKLSTSYQSIIGFEMVPFNYQLSNLINNSKETFQYFLNKKIKQITLTPLLLKKSISYDNLEFKDFEILDYLGSGGFSQVYLAKCKADSQYCALKFIRKDSITSAKKVKMLENQKNILFSIKHNNLIDLYYAFESKNYIVFGLEYCPNGNLYNYLQKVKTLAEEQAKLIFYQILQGLSYLHDNNILFRDVKLENILFDMDGRIKITDFGLSKPDIEEDQITYSYCGSPQYMAPEMLAKYMFISMKDLATLIKLTIMHQLLFGRSPFYAPKKEDIFFAILNSEPKFPKSPSISKEVKSLIRGLLAKNPKHRIGSLKGIKQILTHPWLRSYCLDEKKLITFPLNNPFLNQNKPNKRLKEDFEQQRQTTKFQRYFFQQSFVNKQMIENIGKKSIKLDSGFKKSAKIMTCHKRKIVKSSSEKKRLDLR